MKITLDTRLSVEENAARYFEDAKSAKAKLASIDTLLSKARAELAALEAHDAEEAAKGAEKKTIRTKHWFEKFRWFRSSDDFLVIGGRDATSNEIVVKKHTDPHDIIFHTEMSGSPFFVIKTEGRPVPQSTLEETGQATAAFSRAWKQAIGYVEVFHVTPEQVSKKAQSGEYIAKGAFMIYGKKNIMRVDLQAAIGVTADGLWMGGPRSAVTKHCSPSFLVRPGKERSSDAAKMLQKKGGGEIDDIIRALPPGTVRITPIEKKYTNDAR